MIKIKIITGKIRAGKTTFLNKSIASIKLIDGILQPTIGENRFFKDIKSNELKEITSQNEDESTFRIGKFIFRIDSFIWAKSKLQKAMESEATTIIIDEFGPLEFEGKGLEPVVSKIIDKIIKGVAQKLIIVIRETLVDDFLKKYKLSVSEVEIIRIENQSNVLS